MLRRLFGHRRRPRQHPQDLLAEAALRLPSGAYTAADRVHDFRATFGTPEGQRVLWQIMNWGQLYHTSMVAGDPQMTSFNEGSRNLALRILAHVTARDATDLPPETESESEP